MTGRFAPAPQRFRHLVAACAGRPGVQGAAVVAQALLCCSSPLPPSVHRCLQGIQLEDSHQHSCSSGWLGLAGFDPLLLYDSHVCVLRRVSFAVFFWAPSRPGGVACSWGPPTPTPPCEDRRQHCGCLSLNQARVCRRRCVDQVPTYVVWTARARGARSLSLYTSTRKAFVCTQRVIRCGECGF